MVDRSERAVHFRAEDHPLAARARRNRRRHPLAASHRRFDDEAVVRGLKPDLAALNAVSSAATGGRGNVGVAGLMVGEDLARALRGEPEGHRYLLPDVCLSGGRFLDGTTPADLPRAVEVVATDGRALRRALRAPVAA